MLTGTNLTHTKEYNLRIVHETIRLYSPLSRAEIARRTELTPQTVSNLVKTLMELGLIIEVDKRRGDRGAPSISLALNPDGAYAIGLDLDRDHLSGVLIDLVGTVRQRIHHELHFPSPDEALSLMAETAETLIARQGLGRRQLQGVGVGVPGPMKSIDGGDSYLISPKAFPGWHDVAIAEQLFQRLHVPIFLENNATAAAIGERWYGEGQHIPTFFYIYFGSGLGGGLLVQGLPYDGFSGNVGELGYLPIASLAPPAPGRDQPHVGQHFNLPGLYRSLQAEGLGVSTPEGLQQLFQNQHPSLLAWMDRAVEHLTWLVLTVEYLIDPQAIFFGGRLSDEILEALMKGVEARLPALRIISNVTPTYRVATAGAEAAALGVATLPIYDLFAPTHQILVKQSDAPTASLSTHSRNAVTGS